MMGSHKLLILTVLLARGTWALSNANAALDGALDGRQRPDFSATACVGRGGRHGEGLIEALRLLKAR